MRQSLFMATFAIALVVLFTFVSTFYFLIYTPFAKKLADTQLQDSSEQVRVHLNALVKRLESLSHSAQDWGSEGLIDLDDVEKFRRLFQTILLNGPDISSVVVADEDGNEILLVRMVGDRWMARKSRAKTWKDKAEFYHWSAAGVLEKKETLSSTYDSRTRPWFKTGQMIQNENEVRWTEPFIFKSTQEPGMSAVVKWTGKNGKAYYLANDLLLRDLSRFTTSMTPGINGVAAVFTESGLVIGLPRDSKFNTPADFESAVLKTADEIQIPSLQEGFRAWQNKQGLDNTLFKFKVGRENWLGVFHKQDIGHQAVWIGTLAPESDFLPSFSDQVLLIMINIVTVLLLAWVIATLIARKFASPIEQLVKTSARIGKMDFSAPVQIKSSLHEIDQLIDAQESMRKQLLHATNDLHEANESLEKKVQDRTVALKIREGEAREAVKKLEAAAKEKTDFLAKVSHEIRTPLTVITGLSHLGLSASSNEKRIGYIEKIGIAATRVSTIIDDLLDISKMEVAKLKIKNQIFDLNETLGQVQRILGYKAEEKDLFLDIPQVPNSLSQLIGDPNRLCQILVNLLGNAIKFTSQGSVKLTVTPYNLEKKNCRLKFTVEDTGIGIAPAEITKLFKPFTQLASGEQIAGGSGLGLAICKQLVELMNGTISVESQLGVGSKFIFTLPFAVIKEKAITVRPPTSNSLVGVSVLIVDDQETNQLVVSEILKTTGCNFEKAEDGERAIAVARTRSFDVILMDLMMPKVDGYGATHEIRHTLNCKDTVIIAMTAHASEEDRSRCLTMGFDAVILKPLHPETLIDTISSFSARFKNQKPSASI
ncbi:MAG: ATP-binding protein [Pseudobdellovibrionaceae bacterium]